MYELKAHLCCHSKHNASISSDTYISFNRNISSNKSDYAQQQGLAQASLIPQGWVLGLCRCSCKSQITDDIVWSGLRMLPHSPTWSIKWLWGGAWSEKTACKAEGPLPGYWNVLTLSLPLLKNWMISSFSCHVDLKKSPSKHPFASPCAPSL